MSETTYGFVTLGEADIYFATRLRASSVWNSDADKAGALQTAYNDLLDCGLFAFSDEEEITEGQQRAQLEQAFFLLSDDGVGIRESLRAQGVKSSTGVGETYTVGNGIPICPRAVSILEAYRVTDSSEFPIVR